MRRSAIGALALSIGLISAVAVAPVAAQEEAPPPSPSADAVITTPSELAATELAAQLPHDIAGMELRGTSFTADQILAGVELDELALELASIAQANGAQLNELSVASGGAQVDEAFVTLVAGSIPGVTANQVEAPMVELLLGDTTAALRTQELVAGRDVTVIRATADAGPESTVYVVPSGEVVWLVIADEATLPEAIAAVP